MLTQCYIKAHHNCESRREKQHSNVRMLPFVKSKLSGKKVGLFGSYGWGVGEWMDSWAQDAKMSGVSLAADPVTANDAPDDDAIASCEALGAALA